MTSLAFHASGTVLASGGKDSTVRLWSPTGGQALKILEKQTVSLILTDQRMPGLSGTELLRRMRDTHPDTVRMVVTAQTDPETFIDAIRNSSSHGALRACDVAVPAAAAMPRGGACRCPQHERAYRRSPILMRPKE